MVGFRIMGSPEKGNRHKRKAGHASALALVVLGGLGLGGCSWLPNYANPVEWYRSLSGVAVHDDKGTADNPQNLNAGSKEPFPNLASVPSLPDRALSTVDRDKLEKGLVSDRANAKYSDDELRAGRPVPASGPAEGATLSSGPVAAAPANAEASSPAAGGAPGAPVAPGSNATGPREISTISPGIHSLPQGETPLAAPPPPAGLPPSAASAPAPAPTQTAALPQLPVRDVTPVAPTPIGALGNVRRGKAPAVSMDIGAVSFSGGGTTLGAEDRRSLADVATLYKQNGGTVRVVGYGRRGYGAEAAQQELASFGQALDRAQAVAQALTKLGVPSRRIVVEASPEPAGGGVGGEQAEIFLEY